MNHIICISFLYVCLQNIRVLIFETSTNWLFFFLNWWIRFRFIHSIFYFLIFYYIYISIFIIFSHLCILTIFCKKLILWDALPNQGVKKDTTLCSTYIILCLHSWRTQDFCLRVDDGQLQLLIIILSYYLHITNYCI